MKNSKTTNLKMNQTEAALRMLNEINIEKMPEPRAMERTGPSVVTGASVVRIVVLIISGLFVRAISRPWPLCVAYRSGKAKPRGADLDSASFLLSEF